MTDNTPHTVQRSIVGKGIAHDSAARHVAGEANYIDDMPELPGTLHAAFVLSPVAHGRLKSIDPAQALAMEGVAGVWWARDVPGHNEVGPILHGETLFAEDIVDHEGRVIAVVAARDFETAYRAAKKVKVDIEPLEPVLDIEEAHRRRSYVLPPQEVIDGDAATAIAGAPHVFSGTLHMGGQDHFYLETQIAYAIPGENGEMLVHSSTQHPTEVQHHVALILGLHANAVECQVRRMGGGFGGKESQATIIAGAAALVAAKTGKPCKLRLKRRDDMAGTGKRHDYVANWKVGVDSRGRIRGLDVEYLARAGNLPDLTGPVITRTLTHTDNAYHIPHARFIGHACKTNTVSNTAFRGFGGPQGILTIENIIDTIARELQLDPNNVRAINYYGDETGAVTPYGQPVEDNRLIEVTEAVLASADWRQRRAEIDAHNAVNPVIRRGLAMMPVKFGISFNLTSLNQAGALVHVYLDGSIFLNHGGTEMGQGLFVKVAQVVAEVFQVELDMVRISSTATGKVPNTSATAASTGSDLNGMAAFKAATAIKARMTAVAAEHFGVQEGTIVYREGRVHADNESISFGELAKMAWLKRVQLSEAGHYATPKIHWDGKAMKGRPFFYFTYGAAVTEVAVDTLTGETRCLRADILQDVGSPLNPAIDLGQIEGAFVQGMGWLTCEELWWDKTGRLRTVGPSTYKIPGSRDVPPEFNVRILDNAPNREETVFRSKAIGEPPLMLGVSVWLAIRDAIASLAQGAVAPRLDAPATPENVLRAVNALKQRMKKDADDSR
ncbi:xanthine dehydrogenase molybdopterin binding subunit [Phyllobacterium calauticae]|uniref:xanthine dehydrogenase molybdopterin binding subunit n=1 Tax=Phyllobacterium calauticae TaxID=2817027 RepID=UPI001CBA8F45|nr:xanthine dehydrogenase molybdopterin binding subunit [Phyllobacterium calauticae]MBZ3691358.1 xanthine dehydrogenase molybdopterin binding subunit [Phyllobacterium calauticae]